MLPKSILDAAKAFLCWEEMLDISIQLIPIGHATGFYYPPGSLLHTILLFYDPGSSDYSESVFLLFHEAGHVRQWRHLQREGREKHFTTLLSSAAGPEKALFEHEAWSLGEEIFQRFIQKAGLDDRLSTLYAAHGRRCGNSYRE